MSATAALLAALLASASPSVPADPVPATTDSPAQPQSQASPSPLALPDGAAPCPADSPAPVQPSALSIPLPLADPTAGPPAEPTEIVVSGQLKAPKEDPLRAVNAKSFAVVSKMDDVLVGPLASAYKHALPEPARDGLHNALSNLTEPVVFVNDLLQLKPGRATKTLLRFAINSTLGLGGLFDMAKKKPFHLVHHNNGFADTLGYYGVGPGPYLYLPLIGPTTVRDLFGRTVDLSLLPIVVGSPFSSRQFSLPNSGLKSMDDRITFDARQRYFRDDTSDPYGSERAYYLQVRANEIAGLHGQHPELATPFPGTVPAQPTASVCPPAAAQKP